MREVKTSRLREWVESRVKLFEWIQSIEDGIVVKGRDQVGVRARDYILNKRVMLEGMLERIVFNPVCGIKGCKACCFFDDGNLIGVPVDKSVVSRIRVFSEAAGIGASLKAVDVGLLKDNVRENLLKYSDEYFFSEGGSDFVYYTALNRGRQLSVDVLTNLPRFNERQFMWNKKDSMACVFLDGDGRCMLYGRGLAPSVCREFICVTGNAVNFLCYLGFTDYGRMNSMPLSVLNEVGVRVNEVLGGRLPELELEFEEKFRRLVGLCVGGRDIPAGLLDELERLDAEILGERVRNFQALLSDIEARL
jgi:Fe-S-cluster containining protein